jgi:hypothetical protein
MLKLLKTQYNKLLRWIYNKLDKRFKDQERINILDDYKYFTGPEEVLIREYQRTIESVPEAILLKLLDMIEFFKYRGHLTTIKWYNPKTEIESEIVKWELKWIFKTRDFFADLLKSWLPDHKEKYDDLTNTKLWEIDAILKKTYANRVSEIKWIIGELDKTNNQ